MRYVMLWLGDMSVSVCLVILVIDVKRLYDFVMMLCFLGNIKMECIKY